MEHDTIANWRLELCAVCVETSRTLCNQGSLSSSVNGMPLLILSTFYLVSTLTLPIVWSNKLTCWEWSSSPSMNETWYLEANALPTVDLPQPAGPPRTITCGVWNDTTILSCRTWAPFSAQLHFYTFYPKNRSRTTFLHTSSSDAVCKPMRLLLILVTN